nr:MAG TPA: hypothetical protein [Caudoviricetes sp.]
MIAGRDRKVISVSDHDALIRLFRGVFFPADYDDALTACDRHEDYAADAALRRLRALEAPVVA